MTSLIAVGIALTASPVTPSEAQAGRLPPGDYERTMTFDGVERTFRLHIPPGYNGREPFPLVVGLHGLGDDNAWFVSYSKMDEKVDKLGCIALYPNALGEEQPAWNAGHCCNLQLRDNPDDVGFILALIRTTQGNLNIDPNRVYATGMSNGGMLAYRLAAEASDVFAAVGPVAASIGGRYQKGWPEVIIPPPSEPVSVIAIHGMQDESVPYEGGEGGSRLSDGRSDVSVAESIGFWVLHDGCDLEPHTEVTFEGSIITDTFSCPDGITVELITIVDGEHAWPGASIELSPKLPQPNHQISATDVILDFFAAHSKPSAGD